MDEETETVKSDCFFRLLEEQVVKLDVLRVVQTSRLLGVLYGAQSPQRVISMSVMEPIPQ